MKKKFCFNRDWNFPGLIKLLKVMKLTVFLLLVSVAGVLASKSFAQSKILNLNMSEAAVKEVLNSIEKQSEFCFLYSENLIDVERKINIIIENKKIEQALKLIFEGTDVEYSIRDRFIVLTTPEVRTGELKVLQQQKTVSGKVSDSSGAPLPGVTAVVKGRTQGTVTNADGEYTLSNISENTILQFSFVGMKTYEVVIGSQTNVNVTLEEETIGIEEVVAIGYGVQKKINLTGSVASVSSESLTNRPATNSSNLLQGQLTGIQIIQPTGSPGQDDPQILIRGLGSFGASSTPLVLVDGIIGSLSGLNPNDIESVSVLKDASSAAIYGARAANGVILVTTKKGQEGKSLLEYKVDVGIHTPTVLPDFITDPVEYMTMYNIARERSQQQPYFSDEQINAYKNASDKAQYPSFNWVDYYFNPATVTNHNLRFSGGNKKTTYSISLGYLDQPGILPVFNYKRYSTIINLNTQVNKIVKVGTIINMSKKNIVEPRYTNDDIVLSIYRSAPLYTPYLPDGSERVSYYQYGTFSNYSAEADFNPGNSKHANEHIINAQAYIKVTPLKGLVWEVKGGYNYSGRISKTHQQAVPQYLFFKRSGEDDYTYYDNGRKSGGVSDQYTVTTLPSLYSTLTYDRIIREDHTLKILAGFEQQSYKTQYLYGSRIEFASDALLELNAGTSNGQSLSGTASEWAIRSYFGRINYDYKNKYLLEGTIRYDGTSRISPDNRWGTFPSFSAGWLLSNESFIKNNSSWVDMLKLRASYGVLGNQDIGTYPYQDILSFGSYVFGSELQSAALITRLTDQGLKWESTKVKNFGMDLSIFHGLFSMTLDMFNKRTYDIITTQPVPGSLGLQGPVTNDGELQNKGFEAEFRHSNRINELKYNAYFLISTYRNKLLKIRTPTKGVNEVGLPYNSYYMYQWDGIFQSQKEIDNSPTQPYFPPSPGDLKIKDQTGDGVVDDDDRKTVKGRYPDFIYSFGFNTEWRGFGLSVFFQGVQGIKMPLMGWGIDPFLQGTPPTTRFRDAWSPTNPSNTVPALYDGWGYGGVTAYPSTYYLHNTSYLRLKNINLSYNLPEKITKKIKSQGIKLYISGDNLLTFTKFEGADPETLGHGSGSISGFYRYAQYPQVKIINFGVDIKF